MNLFILQLEEVNKFLETDIYRCLSPSTKAKRILGGLLKNFLKGLLRLERKTHDVFFSFGRYRYFIILGIIVLGEDMRVIKYKKSTNGKYKVFLDDGRELSLYEDVILKFNFLIVKDINDAILMEALRYNQECDVYYVALKSLKNRFRSVFELKTFLLHKQYPSTLIDLALNKLEKQGYLDDRSFAKSYINNQMLTTNKGPLRLEKELLEKKVPLEIVCEEMECFSLEEQENKINKLIQKNIKSNHSTGGVVLMRKVYNRIKDLGYDVSLINSVISNYSFESNIDIAKREYDKLYRRYSRKYSGEELKRKIREKLFLKGLCYDELFSDDSF